MALAGTSPASLLLWGRRASALGELPPTGDPRRCGWTLDRDLEWEKSAEPWSRGTQKPPISFWRWMKAAQPWSDASRLNLATPAPVLMKPSPLIAHARPAKAS